MNKVMAGFLVLVGMVSAQSAMAHKSDSAYKACIADKHVESICGAFTCPSYTSYGINATTFVVLGDGRVSKDETNLAATLGYTDEKEAKKEAANILRGLVAQGICPSGALVQIERN